MKKRLFIALVVIAMTAVAISGCKKKEPEEKPTEIENIIPATEITPTEESEQPEEIFPEGQRRSYLTGSLVDEELASRRPIAIMVENTSVALPQYGISKADVIYECPVEGGISRLLAFFEDYSGMERIGNVRSSRPYYVYFAKEFDSVYVHAGGSIEAYEVLDARLIDDIDSIKGNGASCFFRIKDRKSPHNLYISSEEIDKGIANCQYNMEFHESYSGHFLFAKDDETIDLKDGVDAAVVTLYLVNPKPWFEYHEDDGLYYRFEFNKPQVDAVNDNQLAVKNIIIEECGVTFYDESKGYLNIDITSGGNGKYITNGKCIDITWEKTSDTEPTHYYDKDGNEIVLNQGKTWVAVTQDKYADRNKIYATVEEYKNSK